MPARPDPLVDLSYPGNITPWIFLRNLLQDMGSQYRVRLGAAEAGAGPLLRIAAAEADFAHTHTPVAQRRIQRYTGYGIIVVIALTIWIALTAFTMPQRAIAEFLEPGEAQLLLFFAVFYVRAAGLCRVATPGPPHRCAPRRAS